jgi:hypothetical protein
MMRPTFIGIFLASLAVGAVAQTTVTTGGGSTNTVPVFTGGSTLGNSPISISGGNVGIGTTSPQALLSLFAVTGENNGLKIQATGWPTFSRIGENGTSGGQLVLSNNYSFANNSVDISGYGTAAMVLDITTNNSVTFQTGPAGVAPAPRMTVTGVGNVGIGTTSPGAPLEVNGNIKMTSNPSNPFTFTFSDGTIQTTAYTGVICGGDYAESVNVTGDRTRYEPGDVIVIDPSAPGKFLKSAEPYSTLVSGIYSTKPGVVGRRQLTDRSQMKDELPMAMTGIVPTKVSAENGPIRTGDLLVASATMGHAMKGTNRSLLTGAVIGKALGNLDSGTGIIEVLVTLQ